MKNKVLSLFLLFTLLNSTNLIAQVVSYSLPSCDERAAAYTLTANSRDIPVTSFSSVYNYAHFSFQGKTTITITASADISSYSISPLASNIVAQKSGKTLTFTLDKPQYLIVKINSLSDLVIAADELETDRPASSGAGIYNVLSAPYNSDATGTLKTSGAIQRAIDDASASGNGIVYIPSGVYLCGSLILKSNVSLYLEGGAVIRGTGRKADYQKFYRKTSLNMDGTWFIYTATNATNIKIYGRGTIDGNGLAMRQNELFLNNILVPIQCSHFTVDGIVIRNSGVWGTIVTRSNDVVIKNTKHFNENNVAYEDDAIDVQESQNVLIQHTVAVSEDDTYSTKTWTTGTDIAANWPGSPEVLSNVVFDDCLGWSRCATYKIGFGVYQNQTDIVFKNSVSYRSMRAIAVNNKYGNATVQNVTFDSIDIEGYWPRSGNASKWLDGYCLKSGAIRNLNLKNINVRSQGSATSNMYAESTSVLDGVTFENITMPGKTTYAATLSDLNITNTNNATNIQIKNTISGLSNNQISDKGLNVFPQIFTDNVRFNFELNKEQKVRIKVCNLMGQVVYAYSSMLSVGNNTVQWDIQKSLLAGIYLSAISIGEEQYSYKLIKKDNL